MMWSLRMRQRRSLRRAAALVFVTALACAADASAPRLESAWTAEALTIDGVLKEWVSLVSLDPVKLSVGTRNDGRFLYVALTASDPSTRMLLGAAGVTVWFDPAGKNKKAFGIAIPPTMIGGPGMRGGGPDAMEPLRHVEVAGPGKDDRRRLELTYARTVGIDVAARLAEGVLVYEIRVPLAASTDQPYAVRSGPGATIGLGIESNKLERGDEGGRGRGGRGGGTGGGPGGGIGGPGGMGGGRIGGGMGGGMMGGRPPGGGRAGMEETKPIKVWTVVRLANPPA